MSHPKFLKNQIRKEMRQANISMPGMSILTAICFLAEVQGWAKLYDSPDEAPFWLYNFIQFPLFLVFTDFFIYWIHRGLHHPAIYKHLHKPHHKWIVPTPFASHAFHPLDGFAQSIPYHVFPFVFPLQKFAYVALFVFVNVWTISIHDGEHLADHPIINGAACHTIHHERFVPFKLSEYSYLQYSRFNYNYGQYTTIWDRLGGTYTRPDADMFDRNQKGVAKQTKLQQIDAALERNEGKDDREYSSNAIETKKTQ
jgi:Delta7-sterol 5-desaturase